MLLASVPSPHLRGPADGEAGEAVPGQGDAGETGERRQQALRQPAHAVTLHVVLLHVDALGQRLGDLSQTVISGQRCGES